MTDDESFTIWLAVYSFSASRWSGEELATRNRFNLLTRDIPS